MEEQEPQKLADELEHDTDRLEHRADELGNEIDDVRSDWKRKRNDSNIPGAPPEEEPERAGRSVGARGPTRLARGYASRASTAVTSSCSCWGVGSSRAST